MTDSASVLTAPSVATIDEFSERLAAIQRAVAATDGLGYFNRMYAQVTTAVGRSVQASAFADPQWMSSLDVVFGNLYLDAVRKSVQAPDQVPRAWAALLERRSDARVTPLQFALAGMNAHINRDLPVAVVSTCTQLQTTPDSGSHHADFTHVNAVLATVEPAIRQALEDAFLLQADRDVPGLQDVVANFDMAKARETAWSNARTLWFLQQLNPADGAAFLVGLDHLAGFAGRGLLVPLLGGLTPASK
jgi:uncharacterized protein DUF5995